MRNKKPANFKWTKEKCHEEALKYSHKIDFKKSSRGAYPAALNNKWIDEICSHMTPLGNEYKRLIYRFLFPDNFFYVGLTSNSIRRKNEHLNKDNSVVYQHIIDTKTEPYYEELTDYLDIKEAKKQENYWKKQSEREGYLSLNKAKTGALGSNVIKWSKEKCMEVALKYDNKTEFRASYPSAFQSSYKNGWIDEVCSHMIPKYKNWKSKDVCKQEALKYSTRYEFSVGSCSSWDSARRNGWLDEICSHMLKLRNPKGYWTLENSINEAKKYKKSSEFKKKSSRAYTIVCNNNLIDTIFKK